MLKEAQDKEENKAANGKSCQQRFIPGRKGMILNSCYFVLDILLEECPHEEKCSKNRKNVTRGRVGKLQ